MLSTCKQAGSLLAQAREAEEMMLSQATIFGYKTLTELGTALGGQEQKDIDDLIKTITDGEAAMKKLCVRRVSKFNTYTPSSNTILISTNHLK
jgi:hypothetical protein